ncbi:MAG: hypothetical protein HFF60_03290 [Oscillospiraceae bacterium]|nr:hypothetical protein [Oscillospiraceae bacterium]MCI9586966.1 hypothetical protein [Oscillospiraceae bacterium]
MSGYTFEEIKGLLLQCIEQFQCEAELRLKFAGRPYEYMIIIYDDHCSFLRCGTGEQGGVRCFASIDALYRAEQIDGIVLERDWGDICGFDCMDFEILGIW